MLNKERISEKELYDLRMKIRHVVENDMEALMEKPPRKQSEGLFSGGDMIEQNKIQLLPLSDIRGFDTTGMSAGIYVTEAQNMDISLMKLALQRIGEDCVCIIDGDYNAQVDLIQYEGSRNGMRRMSEVFRGEDFYGEIELQNIYRSRIANIAELM